MMAQAQLFWQSELEPSFQTAVNLSSLRSSNMESTMVHMTGGE